MSLRARILEIVWPCARAIVILTAVLGPQSANGQEGPSGITQRMTFPAFNPEAPRCSVPPGLAKVLAFVQENEREFLQGVDHGLSRRRGIADWNTVDR